MLQFDANKPKEMAEPAASSYCALKCDYAITQEHIMHHSFFWGDMGREIRFDEVKIAPAFLVGKGAGWLLSGETAAL